MERKIDSKEAVYIVLLHSAGLKKKEIADRFGYNYMGIINVLRGNSYSQYTGILNDNIQDEEFTVVRWLLMQGHPYRKVAEVTGIDANKCRNIKGYMEHVSKLHN